jgi:hypothetical protein
LDRISCLKRVPHMIWVDDFKNWRGTQCRFTLSIQQMPSCRAT